MFSSKMPARLELYDIKEDLSNQRVTAIHLQFLENDTVREYMYATATPLSQFLQEMRDSPIKSNLSIIWLLGASKFPLSSLTKAYLDGIPDELIKLGDILPREFRFWILSRKEMPSMNREELEVIKESPNLYPAWKYFPEQVKRWKRDEEYQRLYWPYDTPLPENISYDTLHPDAEPFDVPLVIPWSSEFPYREAWVSINRNYDPKKHMEEYGEPPHYDKYSDADL